MCTLMIEIVNFGRETIASGNDDENKRGMRIFNSHWISVVTTTFTRNLLNLPFCMFQLYNFRCQSIKLLNVNTIKNAFSGLSYLLLSFITKLLKHWKIESDNSIDSACSIDNFQRRCEHREQKEKIEFIPKNINKINIFLSSQFDIVNRFTFYLVNGTCVMWRIRFEIQLIYCIEAISCGTWGQWKFSNTHKYDSEAEGHFPRKTNSVNTMMISFLTLNEWTQKEQEKKWHTHKIKTCQRNVIYNVEFV